MKLNLTAEQKKRIEQAVSSAEKEINGEIVPCVVQSSSHYLEASWKGSLFIAALALAGFTFSEIYFASSFYLFSWSLAFLLLSGSGVIGWLCFRFCNPFRRLIVGDQRLTFSVQQKSRELFLQNEVFRTEKRTGILILFSLFEKKVVILGDSGINQVVPQKEWDLIAKNIIDTLHQKSLDEAFIVAIQKCGNLLKAHGFYSEKNNPNELPDHVVVGEQS